MYVIPVVLDSISVVHQPRVIISTAKFLGPMLYPSPTFLVLQSPKSIHEWLGKTMNRCRTCYRQVQLGLLSQQTFYGHQSEEHEGWALPCSIESGAHYVDARPLPRISRIPTLQNRLLLLTWWCHSHPVTLLKYKSDQHTEAFSRLFYFIEIQLLKNKKLSVTWIVLDLGRQADIHPVLS